ncbi:MAG: acyl-ACP--UDP-N-acetylglucosamine O-acyltransferase [Candidatus Margulisiibacteriota bacterium]|jgi:UDP-N-acetylglucosamine acyltransferase
MQLDVKQIQEILPHRYPMLMVDRVIELEPGVRAVAIKNVTRNEDYFNGHYPGEPIMPGVLMVEAIAQIGGIVALTGSDDKEGKLAFFATIDNVRFRKPVVPGDQIRFEVETLRLKGSVAKMQGKGYVDGVLVVEAEVMFSLVKKEEVKGGSTAAPAVVSADIDPTASIAPGTKLGSGVKIGPYVIIGENVVLGNGVIVDSHAVIKHSRIGDNCHIHYGAIIGDDPQDISFKDENSWVEIGDRTEIREYVTVHRATGNGNATLIGSDCLICATAHIAHNCKLGNKVVVVSQTQLAGHVQVGDRAVIAGMVGIAQKVRIGEMAMVGGYSRIVQDVPSFMLVEGSPAFVHGLNIVGLQRNNVSAKAINEIKQLYKMLYRSELNISQALDAFEKKFPLAELSVEVQKMVEFIKNTKKGISKKQKPATSSDQEDEQSLERFESEGLFAKLRLF